MHQAAARSAALRQFYARLIAAQARLQDGRIEQAFATVERERFVGPGPWSVAIPGVGYIETPDADPAFLYQNTLIALDKARRINIGEPAYHARWLDALAAQPGETVLQVGVGTGYYTSMLAQLVGPGGQVHAFEIDAGLAGIATRNLAGLPWVTVHARSGIAGDLPAADAIYVNAGTTMPYAGWLDALRPNGRLVFPLAPQNMMGGMLLVRRPAEGDGAWPARFVSAAGFIPCVGGQDPATAQALAARFKAGGWHDVKSLLRGQPADDSCWFAGDGWWLSTRAPAVGNAAQV